MEETLPIPSALRFGGSIGTLLFVSSTLPDAVHDQFQTALGPTRSIHWPKGDFYPGWQPFSPDGTSVDQRGFAAASAVLGQSVPSPWT